MRPRFSAAGGKNDSFDAFVLAELARTDSHRFRMLVPDSDQTKALRALSRAREELVAHRVALANEPRTQLECFWPGAAHIGHRLDRHPAPDPRRHCCIWRPLKPASSTRVPERHRRCQD
jgi:transposase